MALTLAARIRTYLQFRRSQLHSCNCKVLLQRKYHLMIQRQCMSRAEGQGEFSTEKGDFLPAPFQGQGSAVTQAVPITTVREVAEHTATKRLCRDRGPSLEIVTCSLAARPHRRGSAHQKMADPVSIANIGSAASAAGKVLSLFPSDGATPKFGVSSDPSAERKCKQVQVFVKCVGRTSTTLYRHHHAPTTSPEQVLEQYAEDRGRAVTQEIIQDENGFELSQALRTGPLSNLSSGCRLNLSAIHRNNIVNEGMTTGASAVSATTGALTSAVETATGELSAATRRLFGRGPGSVAGETRAEEEDARR